MPAVRVLIDGTTLIERVRSPMIISAESPSARTDAPPLPLRIAATLCLVIGVVNLLGAVAVSVPLAAGPDGSWFPPVLNILGPLLALLAAGFIWRRRRIGVLLLVLAWGLPTAITMLSRQSPRGPALLLVVALIAVGANWKLLA